MYKQNNLYVENSENNTATKCQLDESNFKLWKQQIYLLLKSHDLIEYIYQEILKKVPGSELTSEQKASAILVDGTIDTYYNVGTKKDQIKKDTKAKNYLMNSISNDIAADIDFVTLTAYEIYQIIKGMNISDDKDRIQELKNELDSMKYNETGSLSIFISNMSMKFNELEKLGENLTDKDKIDYLYNTISEDLADKANLLKETTWTSATKNLVETYQRIKKLREKRNKNNDIVSNSTNVESNNSFNNNKINTKNINIISTIKTIKKEIIGTRKI
eukprot:jgi/Orpsp1_1/1178261/evm.model.c7180000064607.2